MSLNYKQYFQNQMWKIGPLIAWIVVFLFIWQYFKVFGFSVVDGVQFGFLLAEKQRVALLAKWTTTVM